MSNYQIETGSYASEAPEVSSAHFGAVYSTFFGLSAYEAQSGTIGATNFRWPGGTRGEFAIDELDKDGDGDVAEYLYGLHNDNLMAIGGKGLSDCLAAAVAAGADFALFLPSIRYLDDPETSSAAVEAFVTQLLNGAFGTLPRKVVIEIGNETLDGTADRARAYGELADVQIQSIQRAIDAFEGTLPDIEIGVQIGRSAEEDAAIRDAISDKALSSIDVLIAHHLPINISNHNKVLASTSQIDVGDSRFTRSVDYIDNWEKAVARVTKDAAVDLDFFVSAWTVGPSSPVSHSALEYQDIGARQARTTVDTFVQLLAAGADAASLWGIDGRGNPNFFIKLHDGSTVTSHGGEAFKLMSESLDGMRLLGGHLQAEDSSNWVYAFEDTEKYVLFVVGNDIDGTETVTIELDNVDTDRAIEVARIGTTITDTGDLVDGDETRQYETPILSTKHFSVAADEFQFDLSQDFEVNRLTVWKDVDAVENIAPAWDSKSASQQLFSDDAKSSVLSGRDNDWSIGGTETDEVIVDAKGDNLLSGGGGSDRFVFRKNGGDNIILDFGQGDGADQLLFYGFGYASNDDARSHMSINQEGVLFQDQGTSVLLDGLMMDDLADLTF